MFSNIRKVMDEALNRKLVDIRRLSLAEIELLPEYSDEIIKTDKGKKITLALWCNKCEDNVIQLVVQVYHRGFLGCGMMVADGFLIDASGDISKLPEEIRLEYC